jgi:hypothetical protein
VLWRRLIRVGLRCPLDLCRYLLVPRDCVCKVLFQPSRCRFSPQHSGACRRCTMIGRGSPFQSPHPERILNIRNTRVGGIRSLPSPSALRPSRRPVQSRSDPRRRFVLAHLETRRRPPRPWTRRTTGQRRRSRASHPRNRSRSRRSGPRVFPRASAPSHPSRHSRRARR